MSQVKKNFELDYWGLSYRKAIEYILGNDASSQIKLYMPTHPEKFFMPFLPLQSLKRLQISNSPDNADYILSEYRWHPEEYEYPNSTEYYSIKVGDTNIMVAYRINK